MHNGRAVSGIAHPNFTAGGRYAKYLPARLLERYTDAAQDTELLALRDDIALLDARLADLLTRVDSGESADAWSGLRSAWTAYLNAPQDDRAAKESGITDILALQRTDYEAWEQIRVIVEQRAKLVESERKRLIDMQAMVTAEQAMTLMAAIADSVRRNVTDPHIRAAISADIQRLTTR